MSDDDRRAELLRQFQVAIAGAELDDPETLVTLDGGIDDPDGLDGAIRPSTPESDQTEGWDLDEPLTDKDGAEQL